MTDNSVSILLATAITPHLVRLARAGHVAVEFVLEEGLVPDRHACGHEERA